MFDIILNSVWFWGAVTAFNVALLLEYARDGFLYRLLLWLALILNMGMILYIMLQPSS
jgi:hypothetical protein